MVLQRAGLTRLLGATGLALALLGACTVHSPPRPDEAKVKAFAGRGYLTDQRHGTTTTLATWQNGNGSFDVALAVPVGAGPFPLVIYLPALGENSAAGNVWRTAWAQAGYAALSIQPLAEDAHAWSSERARAGDFAVLARERYSASVMSARIEALRAALAELRRRHDRQEPPLDRIDLARVALAGYDLGGYTAMAVAGEQLRGAQQPSVSIPISAFIVLSPYADFSGAALGERYRSVHGPVLLITSDADADPLGVVTPPSLRRAPFEYMPGGDKYLLTFRNVAHKTLAGGDIAQDTSEEGGSPDRRAAGGPSQDGGRGTHRRRGEGSAGSGAVDAGADRFASLDRARLSPTVQAMDVAAIQSVTTAFLDAFVKGDPIAREWLARDAPGWIGERGELREK